ncbi:hypothetical protein FB451DRAFT_1250354 [Mycena latifolia]|nr:hypothetical protein FB451DRAFT_1250354 [Mycena latifolia]
MSCASKARRAFSVLKSVRAVFRASGGTNGRVRRGGRWKRCGAMPWSAVLVFFGWSSEGESECTDGASSGGSGAGRTESGGSRSSSASSSVVASRSMPDSKLFMSTSKYKSGFSSGGWDASGLEGIGLAEILRDFEGERRELAKLLKQNFDPSCRRSSLVYVVTGRRRDKHEGRSGTPRH